MKLTGMVRRVDELGRIVIPKEIRKNINIHNGEELEITIDNDSIILKKSFRIKNDKNKLDHILDNINYILNYDIIITDLDSIIASTNKELSYKKIDKKIYNIINNREDLDCTEVLKLNFGDIELQKHFYGIPIITNSDCLGMCIIYKDEKITINEKNIIKVIVDLLASFYDIS